jgi:hypothetical protein
MLSRSSSASEKLTMVEFAIDSRNTALVWIDIQNCFVEKISFLALRAAWGL